MSYFALYANTKRQQKLILIIVSLKLSLKFETYLKYLRIKRSCSLNNLKIYEIKVAKLRVTSVKRKNTLGNYPFKETVGALDAPSKISSSNF